MNPRDLASIELARAIVEQRSLNHVKIGVLDIDGILRDKDIACDKFFSALKTGFGFCDVIVGWDSYDQLYDNISITGWHTGYPHARVRTAPESCREIPWENHILFFLAEFDSPHKSVCRRAILRRVVDRSSELGLDVMADFEYDFEFVLKTLLKSLKSKTWRNYLIRWEVKSLMLVVIKFQSKE